MRISDWSSDVCSSDLFLEVGFGGGEHLAWQAARHPAAGFLAAEYFITGVASLLGHLRAAGSGAPLRLYIGDARDLLDCLPDAVRSEEHTSELQSLMRISYAVFCLKKKNKQLILITYTSQTHRISN